MEKILYQWEKNKPTESIYYPVSREGHSLTKISENKILWFGGVGTTLLNDLYLYNIKLNTWSIFKTFGREPSPRCYHQSFLIDNNFYIYGGQSEKGRSIGDLFLLNLENKIWKKILIFDPPSARHQFTLTALPNNPSKLLLFGGISIPDNIFFNDVWEIDLSYIKTDDINPSGIRFNKIMTKGEKPEPRKSHCSVIFENKLIIFGGLSHELNFNTSEIFYLNLENNTWVKIGGSYLPEPRSNFCWIKKKNSNQLLIFGGLENKKNKSVGDIITINLKDFHCYTPFIAGKNPNNRHGMAIVEYKDNEYMILGGMHDYFETMDIYFLKEVSYVKDYSWVKIIEKTKQEKELIEDAKNFIYEKRKKLMKIDELICKEKFKNIDINKELEDLDAKYKTWMKNNKEVVDKQEYNKIKLDEEYNNSLEQIESLITLIKEEELYENLENDHILELENSYIDLQKYLINSDNIYLLWNKKINKYDKNLKQKELKNLINYYIKLNKENREEYKENLNNLKKFYIDFEEIIEKSKKEIIKKNKEIEKVFPQFNQSIME